MMDITKNIKEATAITHGGTFHADEVMATIILNKVFGNITVCRTFRVPEEWNSLYASLLTQLSLSSYVHGYLYVLSNHSSVLIPLHDLSI